MEKKVLHEKLQEILNKLDFNNFLDSLNSIEFFLEQNKQSSNEIFIPNEANFQIPHQFLEIKQNNEIEKILSNVYNLNINIKKLKNVLDYISQLSINNYENKKTSHIYNDYDIINLINKKYFG